MRALIVFLSILLVSAVGDASAKVARSKAVLAEFQKLHPCPANGKNDAPEKKAEQVKPNSDNTCHTGPRGGRYRIVNGHKRYGC